MSKNNKICPACGKKLKSSSGYTLHIKKCCPEMQYVETKVKLTLTFTVPRDVSKISDPMGLFRDSFGAYDKKDGGYARLDQAWVVGEPVVTPRKPNKAELSKIAKAEKNKSKTATVAELKKIVNAAIEAKWKLKANTAWVNYVRKGKQMSGHWPDFIKITASAPPPQGRRYSSCSIYFVFDIKKETVIISTHETSYINHDHAVKEVRLADPKLFEIIREIRDKKLNK